MSTGVELWWVILSVISVANIAMWFYSARLFYRRNHRNSAIYKSRVAILWLSAVYVSVCAFRSFLPRIDLERICLIESWFSSMLVGRIVATVAEVSFIVQCALLLREAATGTDDRLAEKIALLLIPIILLAECFSWYAVISTHYLGSVIEESLWTLAGILLVISFISLWSRVSDGQKRFILVMILVSVGYIIFMMTVDVPLYWSRWMTDVASGVEYFRFRAGILDAAQSCTVRLDWQAWRQEIPWMTLYFTAAVWVSIYLPHAPAFKTVKQR